MAAIHSATSDELTYLRAKGRMARFALAFPQSNIIWQGRINQASFDLSYMSYLVWDTQTGDYADIVEGMTLWIGSAAGLYDVGRVRIRKAATATHLFFDPVSKIRFLDNLYLTVVDDFEIKSKLFTYDADRVPYANTDVSYTDENEVCKPVVIMGGDSVVELISGAGSVQKILSDSWVPGGTITDYLCECVTADSIDDSTTDSPTINFTAAGTHLIKITITASNGETTVRYQKVVVWDADNLPAFCRLESVPFEGFQDGGGECSVRAFSGVDISLVKPNAKVILFDVKSVFDGDEISMGQCVGSENIFLSGYIVGESIQTDQATGEVLFTIRGVQDPMKRARGNAFQITRTIISPTTWGEIENPTADLLYWHFITWQTTLSACVDCYPPNLDTIYPDLEGVKGTLFEQLIALGAKNFIFPGCDRWGRLFFEVDADYLSDDDKDAITEVMTITTADRASARVDVDSNSVSVVYGSAVTIEPTQTLPKTVYSVSPGKAEDDEGNPVIEDYYAPSQAEANGIAGRIFANRNNNETVYVSLPQNNRLISVFPRQVIIVTIADTENPRQEYTGPMVPRNIRYVYDEQGGVVSVEISGKYLQPEALSANGAIPISDGEGGFEDFELPTDIPGFDIPDLMLPELPEFEFPLFPGDEETISKDQAIAMTQAGEMWFTDQLSEIDQAWWKMDPDQNLLGDLRSFITTPDGHIYLIYKRQIYWATVEDQKFRILFGPEYLESEYPGGFEPFQQIIAAYGVSPVDPNKILLIMGSGYTGSRIGHFWSGDHTGVTRGVEVNIFDVDFYPYSSTDGSIRLVDGNWLCTYGTAFGNYAVSLIVSLDGSSIIDGSTVQTGRIQALSPSQGLDVFLYGQDTFNILVLSSDGGLSVGSALINPSDSLGISFGYTVASSPSNSRLMVIYNNAGTPEIHSSNDSGASFSALTLPANFEPSTIFCIDEDKWMAAGREDTGGVTFAPLIYYTDDFGVNWFPKYGNWPIQLPDVGAGIRRIHIR
jgi:hypothetical protein